MVQAAERRSPLATLAGLLLFLLVAVGTACILTLLVSVGPGAESAWSDRGIASLPLGSRLALGLSRLVEGAYWPVMAVTVALHAALLLFCGWAGHSGARLSWAALVVAALAALQLVTLLWLGIAFTFPFLS